MAIYSKSKSKILRYPVPKVLNGLVWVSIVGFRSKFVYQQVETLLPEMLTPSFPSDRYQYSTPRQNCCCRCLEEILSTVFENVFRIRKTLICRPIHKRIHCYFQLHLINIHKSVLFCSLHVLYTIKIALLTSTLKLQFSFIIPQVILYGTFQIL